MTLRFDIDAVHEQAGDKVFARGQAYHRAGQVEIIALEDSRVLARVVGSEVYRTELRGRGHSFSGTCSCPAFSDWGFCKHLVATALAINEGAAAETAAGDNPFERIRRHLKAQGVEALVEMIVGMAERDEGLFQSLDLAAAADQADDEALFDRFRKAITAAARTRGYVEYREAAGWAEGIGTILDRIDDLLSAGRAALTLRLLDHFFARLEKALNEIDDSDGHSGSLAERGRDIHLRACRAARPDQAALARDLYAREMGSGWDFFYGSVSAYADVLGEAGRAEYRRLAGAAWAKLKPVGGERKRRDEEFGQRYKLAAILDALAEMDGDTDARIAIRAKDLSSSYRYLGLAQFCLAHDREAEAVRWAEEGLWQFEDDPDERLIGFAADLYLRLGRSAEAEALLWKSFERRPSLEIYRRLKTVAGDAAVTRDRAITLLQARLAKAGNKPQWSSPADLLVRLLMNEGQFALAWETAQAHGVGDGLLSALAEASEGSHPREALAVHVRRVDHLVGSGGQKNYEDAMRLVSRIGILRQSLGDAAGQAAYVAGLKTRYKAKRNFMKLLQP